MIMCSQVRFHPLDSDIFASGSLDHKVVLWRISTGEKVFTHDFGARAAHGRHVLGLMVIQAVMQS